jgi:hypothetical protein
VFKETIDLRNKLVALEEDRVRETRKALSSGGKQWKDVLTVLKAEEGIIALLRMRLQDDIKSTEISRNSLEARLKALEKNGPVPDAVKSGLNVALLNASRHVECLTKFADAMEKALKITKANLKKAKRGGRTKVNPTPLLEDAQKYLAEDDTCLNNIMEAMWATFVDSEQLGTAFLTGQI